MIHLDALDRVRLQHGAEHLHALGARATAELLSEIADRIGGMPCILALLTEYQQRLSRPRTLRALDGDRFPVRPMRVVPR